MEKIRVLVVDDSIIVRRVITEVLTAQPDLEVVGEAVNGRIAIEKTSQLRPDLVILDIEMPEMDGLTALTHLHRAHPNMPIIMFSSHTALGAAATLEALARGASDFFAKPSGAGGLEASRQLLRNELVPAIRALCAKKVKSEDKLRGTTAVKPLPRAPSPAARIDIVVVGASTGGPNALAQLFTAFPHDFRVPILVVQHMPRMFTQMLAERLTKISTIRTYEAVSGTELEPGKAWVAPGDYHLTLIRDAHRVRTRLDQGQPEHSCRPAVDPLLRSVASIYGANCLAVVLTGMGQDGLLGCRAIREAGGQILVQDEETSVVWGMPGAVAKAGLADSILPLSQLPGEIVRRTRMHRD